MSKQGTLAWCDRCAENVRVLEADVAAVLVGKSSQALYSEVEAGRVHFVETEGRSLVCPDSLAESQRSKWRRAIQDLQIKSFIAHRS